MKEPKDATTQTHWHYCNNELPIPYRTFIGIYAPEGKFPKFLDDLKIRRSVYKNGQIYFSDGDLPDNFQLVLWSYLPEGILV